MYQVLHVDGNCGGQFVGSDLSLEVFHIFFAGIIICFLCHYCKHPVIKHFIEKNLLVDVNLYSCLTPHYQ